MKVYEIAERILTVGGTPIHSFEDYLATGQIKPIKNVHDAETAVKTIVENIEHLVSKEIEIKGLAGDADDGGTEDQMSAFVEEQEKTLWMYKAWLK
jgi:starvation-inducible DNA-binding protein